MGWRPRPDDPPPPTPAPPPGRRRPGRPGHTGEVALAGVAGRVGHLQDVDHHVLIVIAVAVGDLGALVVERGVAIALVEVVDADDVAGGVCPWRLPRRFAGGLA